MMTRYNIYYRGEKMNSTPIDKKSIDMMKEKDMKLKRNVKNLPEIETTFSKCKVVKCIVM